MDKNQISRWRLILGKVTEEEFQDAGQDVQLSGEQEKMDYALGAIYDNPPDQTSDSSGGKKTQSGGLKKSAPYIAKWLGDLRECFDSETVSIVQKDAIERKGLKELLYEPEILDKVEPDIHLITTLLALKENIPEESKAQVRQLIVKYVKSVQEAMSSKIEQQIRGILNLRQSSPVARADSINWQKTIRQNLKNFDLQSSKLIPEKIHYFAHKRKTANWDIIVDIDQSASMAESMVYASVMSAIFASLKSIKTRVVAFDTAVVDLTQECGDDPVDMLYGMQLGGGTDINRSLSYCLKFITEPSRTVFLLISDLYEGGDRRQMISRMLEMKDSGVQVICLLSLSNSGMPFYDELIAKELRRGNIPCFACTPEKLPELIKDVLSGYS